MLHVGLNPYGLTFHLGLQGAGTSRRNPAGAGLEGFLAIAVELGARTLELHNPWLTALSEEEGSALGERIAGLGMTPVISLGPPLEGVDSALRSARLVGARIIRLGLSPVLCGDRAACGPQWAAMVGHVRATLGRFAPQAMDLGIAFAIENHQDFGSQELIDFATEGGANVGICIDTGNPLAVGEEPVAFARKVAPLVRHVHLKDYNAQWTDEGYRLVRCAIGDGCVPFPEIVAALAAHHSELTASLEPGALEVRHVRLFRPEWWNEYAERTVREFAPCLAAARRSRLEEAADWRTPWEKNAPPAEIVAYELAMIRRSAANMKSLGLM
ncbi:MAG: sugar phosphate isomerase/epimerase [Bryobacteraceae bacterium]|nr:sugar phosphate isomerase/epimerase [Bryobacteraceae bacterium]